MDRLSPIDIPQQDLDDLRPVARELILARGLPQLLQRLSPGPYGMSAIQLELLETWEYGLAAVAGVRRALAGRIAADRREGFAPGTLAAEERRFCSLLATSVGLQEALARLELSAEALPGSERHLKLSEYRELLAGTEGDLTAGLVDDLAGYLQFYAGHPDPGRRPGDDVRLRACVGSYLALVARTAQRLGDDGEYAGLLEALRESGLSLAGSAYRGFARQAMVLPDQEDHLLPFHPEDIVGNDEVLAAGLKLCRAVAGYDLERGANPRLVRNPVIFVLGAPGCGKTVTAHAIGNTFLDLCRRHGLPARFRIIRRTDWASHYQNKSANELLRIFRQEIFDFPGVAGAYWPDIDTAFAARDDPGVRAEEKAVLGTLFGLLDGTVGPRNGKWFLIADANYMTMDQAMISRLTQDPYYARGPQSAADFIELLRDKKLARVASQLNIDAEQWQRFGERCVEQGLSGRAVDNIAGKIVALIEDVELPDEYFTLSFDEKRKMIEAHRRRFDFDELTELLERYLAFERDAEQRARQERFDRRVTEIRERLAAQVAAVGSGAGGGT